MKSRTFYNRLLGLVAAVLAASACGGTQGSSTPAADVPGITGKTINVGLSTPLSGSGAVYAQVGQGLKAYLDFTNARGGVGGYKFAYSEIDNQQSATGGADSVRQLLAGTPFILGVTGSGPVGGAAPVLKSNGNGTPVFAIANAATIASSGIDNIYGIVPNYTSESLLQTKFLIDTLKAKNIAIAYEDDAVGQGAGQAVPAWAKSHGATNASAIAVPNNATNFAPYASKLKDTGAEAVEVFAISAIAAGIQKAAAAINYSPKWITISSSLDPSYLKLAGSVAEGTYVDSFTQSPDSTDADSKLFQTEMNKRVPQAASTLGGYGWSIGAIIVGGVSNATKGGRSVTRGSFLSGVNSIKGDALGLLLSVDYTGADHSTVAKALKIYQVKNGAFVEASPLIPIPTS